MAKAHVQLNIMLAPYSHLPSPPILQMAPMASPISDIALRPIASSASSLTRSERLLLGSVQETTREICRVLVVMWSDGVMTGIDDDNWNPGQDTIKAITDRRKADVEGS